MHVEEKGEREIKDGIQFIVEMVGKYNDSIRAESVDWDRYVHERVTQRVAGLQNKHKQLDDLSAALGIPIRKKADAEKAIPPFPRVRARIVPVVPKLARTQTEPVLTADKFEAFLDLIDNWGRQFERTPQSFQQLAEEGLRDIVLGSLNAVFEGAAGGEVFRGIGKVDIHLQLSQGEVFVAELKNWEGPETLREVIGQLRGRLTWRDACGVAIVLSRNASFSQVLKSVRETIPTCDGFKPPPIRSDHENKFAARFSIPTDAARHATLPVLVYNLFTPEPGKRALKRSK